MSHAAQPTLHGHDAAAWRHSHRFVEDRPRAERRTLYAVQLTAVMMMAEIVGGWWTGSMALLADGWHMSTHVLALGIALAAYVIARRLGEDPRFTFGTWKIEILGSFASALLLGVVGVLMAVELAQRLLAPVGTHYSEALWVTAVGLAVNVVCALWLAGAHDHDHGHAHASGPAAGTRRHDDDRDRDRERDKERDDTHEHETRHRDHDRDHRHEHDHKHEPEHDHDEHRHRDHPQEAALHRRSHVARAHAHGDHGHPHHHHDLNLRAAYLHVVADAATSMLALMALFAGKYWGCAGSTRWSGSSARVIGRLGLQPAQARGQCSAGSWPRRSCRMPSGARWKPSRRSGERPAPVARRAGQVRLRDRAGQPVAVKPGPLQGQDGACRRARPRDRGCEPLLRTGQAGARPRLGGRGAARSALAFRGV